MRNYTLGVKQVRYSAVMIIKLFLLMVGAVIGAYLFLTFALTRLVDATMVQKVESSSSVVKSGSSSLYLGQTAISEGEEYDIQSATGIDLVQSTARMQYYVFNEEGSL